MSSESSSAYYSNTLMGIIPMHTKVNSGRSDVGNGHWPILSCDSKHVTEKYH